MLTLPASSFGWIIILVATGVVGGLVAGLSALAGFYSGVALIHSPPTKENAKGA